MSPQSYQKTSIWSAVNFKKHVTLRSCRLEPAIWSRDTGQQIPCFDRCQLLITWMSNIKEVHGKPRLHVSINLWLKLLFGVWPPCCATPPSPPCVRAHKQYCCPWQPWENQFMGFLFPIWLWGSAGAPLSWEPNNMKWLLWIKLATCLQSYRFHLLVFAVVVSFLNAPHLYCLISPLHV